MDRKGREGVGKCKWGREDLKAAGESKRDIWGQSIFLGTSAEPLTNARACAGISSSAIRLRGSSNNTVTIAKLNSHSDPQNMF